MIRILLGGALVVGGIAARIISGHHTPSCFSNSDFGPQTCTGWSQSTYDAVRIGSWALIVLGALVVLAGLVSYWAAQVRTGREG